MRPGLSFEARSGDEQPDRKSARSPVADDFAAELVRNRDPRQHVAESRAAVRRGDRWTATFGPVDEDPVALAGKDNIYRSRVGREGAVFGRVGREFMQQQSEAGDRRTRNDSVNSGDRNTRCSDSSNGATMVRTSDWRVVGWRAASPKPSEKVRA
jgi:hypothetical protein